MGADLRLTYYRRGQIISPTLLFEAMFDTIQRHLTLDLNICRAFPNLLVLVNFALPLKKVMTILKKQLLQKWARVSDLAYGLTRTVTL